MKEKIIELIEELKVELSGEIWEADQCFDSEWSNKAFAKLDVLEELKARIEAIV